METLKRSISPLAIFEQLTLLGIQVPKLIDVQNYATGHWELGCLLPAICTQARNVFGQVAELSLELYRDPESGDEYLTLYVRLDEYDAGILDKIEAVSEQFNSQLELMPEYFLITTDFRRPGERNAV